MTPIERSTDPRVIAAMLGAGDALNVLLDYDGTLVPFAPEPSMARPDEELVDLLRRLSHRPRTRIEIVSGRDRDSLGEWLGHLTLTLRAEHGMWLREAGERAWTERFRAPESALARASTTLDELVAALGGRIERKRAGVAWHYRGASVSEQDVDAAMSRLEREVRELGLEVLRGACVLELRAHGVNKGYAVREARALHPEARVLALGDDVTDEDMFRELRSADLGILVGHTVRPTAARLRLSGVDAARTLLASIAT